MTRGRRNVVKKGKIMLHGNKPPYGYRLEDGVLIIYGRIQILGERALVE